MSEQEKIQHFREYDLFHFKNRRLEQKVEQIIEYIQTTLAPFSKISLSFSGGKDSQLCLMLCAMADIDFEVMHMGNDNYAYPETIDFIKSTCNKYNKKLNLVPHAVDPLQCIVDYGVYGDVGKKEEAYDVIKVHWYEYNKLFEVNITGIRKMESRLRRFILARNKGFEYSKKRQTHFFSPIYDLRNNDVYACITALGDEYHPIYYKANDLKEREWLRMNWYINPNQPERGYFVFLKTHYPELYYKLINKVPYLKTYV